MEVRTWAAFGRAPVCWFLYPVASQKRTLLGTGPIFPPVQTPILPTYLQSVICQPAACARHRRHKFQADQPVAFGGAPPHGFLYLPTRMPAAVPIPWVLCYSLPEQHSARQGADLTAVGSGMLRLGVRWQGGLGAAHLTPCWCWLTWSGMWGWSSDVCCKVISTSMLRQWKTSQLRASSPPRQLWACHE